MWQLILTRFLDRHLLPLCFATVLPVRHHSLIRTIDWSQHMAAWAPWQDIFYGIFPSMLLAQVVLDSAEANFASGMASHLCHLMHQVRTRSTSLCAYQVFQRVLPLTLACSIWVDGRVIITVWWIGPLSAPLLVLHLFWLLVPSRDCSFCLCWRSQECLLWPKIWLKMPSWENPNIE